MREFSLPYGSSKVTFNINPQFDIHLINPGFLPPIQNADAAIKFALENPISQNNLKAFNKNGTVGIAINDNTRPVPKPNPVQSLLTYLENLGFARESIALFVGSGTHKSMSAVEMKQILPEYIIEHYNIQPHDCDNSPMVDLGKTKFNTPILINQTYHHCDLKITVGNIEPHHFMGYSGGVKTAAIGLAGRDTITANHAMLIDEQAQSGIYHTNPLRQDIEEIGCKTEILFTLGTILDEDKHLLKVFFGEPRAVMHEAIPHIRKIFGVTVPKPFDLVIASPGGHPKDINLYQAEKGLTHAARITRDGGWVILIAKCPEGSGSSSYEEYVIKAQSHQSILNDFHRGFFEIGPHKAFQIAREAKRLNIILVSDIHPEVVNRWKLIPGQPQQVNKIINQYTAKLQANARIAIMPAATRTMTEIRNE